MDVVIDLQGERIQAQVPSGAFDGWARRLTMDQEVVAGFDPANAVYYGDDGTRVAGHVDPERHATPVSVGV